MSAELIMIAIKNYIFLLLTGCNCESAKRIVKWKDCVRNEKVEMSLSERRSV